MKKRYIVAIFLALLLTACQEDTTPKIDQVESVEEEKTEKFNYKELEGEILPEAKDIEKYSANLEALKHSDLKICDFKNDIFYGLGHGNIVEPFKLSFSEDSVESDIEKPHEYIDTSFNYDYDQSGQYYIKKDGKQTLMRLDWDNLRFSKHMDLNNKNITQLLSASERHANYLVEEDDSIRYIYTGWDEYEEEYFTEESNMIGMSYYGKNLNFPFSISNTLSQEKIDGKFRNLMITGFEDTFEYDIDADIEIVGFEDELIVLEARNGDKRELYLYHTWLEELTDPLDISNAISTVTVKNGRISYVVDSGHIREISTIDGERHNISLKNLDEDLNKVDIEAYKFRDAYYLKVRDLDGKNPDRFYRIKLGPDVWEGRENE